MTIPIAKPVFKMTSDYSLFELHPLNRKVVTTKHLTASMKKYGYLPHKPIHCVRNGSKLVIKDGHHRFTVAKSLGIPIWYCLAEDGGITIHEIVVSGVPWTLAAYLGSFADDNREPYIEVKRFQEATGITLACCVGMLGGAMANNTGKLTKFKTGTFVIGDRKNAYAIGDIVIYLKNIGITWAAVSDFVKALSRVVYVPEFSVETFKKKAKSHRYLFAKQRCVADYVDLIARIYNRQSTEKIPLVFLADEAAKSRNAVSTTGGV